MKTSLFGRFSKYKGLIVSVALFLLLDASVLMLNFYISFEIADDALGVNLAGRQRMLSQRTMKSLLDTEVSKEDPAQLERALTELKSTTSLFDRTLVAFTAGGQTLSAQGDPITLAPATSDPAANALYEARQLWAPYLNKINTVLNTPRSQDSEAFDQSLQEAIIFGQTNNLALLKLMNDLTVELETVASSKATRLRIIQTIGISLAIINFFIIMFHFLRQLRESDERIEAAQKETQEILNTVDEGLLLLDEDLIIGDQHSKSTLRLFNQSTIAGQSFEELIKEMVSEKDLDTAQNFIKLLFKPSVKEKLIGDLNPLNEVEVHIYQDDGSYTNKYLKFSFSRALQGKKISHVLVAVIDITQEVKLKQQLDNSRNQSNQQIELLYSITRANPDTLRMFINNADKGLNRINQELKASGDTRYDLIAKANKIFALMHNFKGEASALSLDHLVDMAHQFEDEIQQIREKDALDGSDFLGLAVILNDLLNQISTISSLSDHFAAIASGSDSQTRQYDWSHLQQMASAIAEKQSKSVEILHAGLNDSTLPAEVAETLSGILAQLIRNSVSHGIETVEQRLMKNKSERARISISVAKRADESFMVTFFDDGKGFDFNRIRDTAVSEGLMTQQEATTANRKQLLKLIFNQGFSTSDNLDQDAGRGMGMQAIVQQLRELGGKLSISTQVDKGTRFNLIIPPIKPNQSQAA